jgi:hypothetical protein
MYINTFSHFTKNSMVSVEEEEFSHIRETVELVDWAMRRFTSTGRPKK